MTNTTTPVFTSGSIEMELFPTENVAQVAMYNSAAPHNLGALLKLSEPELIEIGLLLIKAGHDLADARIKRGEVTRQYTIAEIADAHTIVARYPEIPED